jgi:transcription factor 7-like 2
MGLAPPMHPGTGLPFFCHNGEHLTQPPPAHTGYNPYQLDPKSSGEYWRGVKGTSPIPADWQQRLNGFITTSPG